MDTTGVILLSILIFIFTVAATVFLINKINIGKGKQMLDEAKDKAEQLKKEKLLQTKEKFLELIFFS